jgi:hypothetical protein
MSNKKLRKKLSITFTNLNQEKPLTCGSCKETQNDLGLVALHCSLLHKQGQDSKVRSWEKACEDYKPFSELPQKGKNEISQ